MIDQLQSARESHKGNVGNGFDVKLVINLFIRVESARRLNSAFDASDIMWVIVLHVSYQGQLEQHILSHMGHVQYILICLDARQVHSRPHAQYMQNKSGAALRGPPATWAARGSSGRSSR